MPHRGHNGSRNADDYLTPPALVEALGPFDLDPCCPPTMPWRTAGRMVHFPREDGLTMQWRGRVWCNPPYSNVRPWVDKFLAHGRGVALVSAKSIDARWGQAALGGCAAAMFMAGRLLFHYEDGTQSTGKFLSNMLIAASEEDVEALHYARAMGYEGVIMRRISS